MKLVSSLTGCLLSYIPRIKSVHTQQHPIPLEQYLLVFHISTTFYLAQRVCFLSHTLFGFFFHFSIFYFFFPSVFEFIVLNFLNLLSVLNLLRSLLICIQIPRDFVSPILFFFFFFNLPYPIIFLLLFLYFLLPLRSIPARAKRSVISSSFFFIPKHL